MEWAKARFLFIMESSNAKIPFMEWAKARFQLIMESSNAEIPFIGMG
jgi:hypothetical protein